ncbi:MAG: hypothetical protein EOP21_00950 [Hyphomicrobiales bacterium]|nr:MAG: hypothetical protein EOP21_00950 [Hyphomicrobiales bacterium]
MSHSTQEFSGRVAVLNDLDVLAFVSAFTQLPTESALHTQLSTVWRAALEVAGPGTIDLKLGNIIRSKDDADALMKFLRSTRELASQAGPILPSSWSKELVTGSGLVLSDSYPSNLLFDAISELESLIAQPDD